MQKIIPFLAVTIKILTKYGISLNVEAVNQDFTKLFLLEICLKCGEYHETLTELISDSV
jgi:hypothetical protein